MADIKKYGHRKLPIGNSNSQGDCNVINVIASIQVKKGRVAEFIEIFKGNVPSVLEEKGCIAYAPTVDMPTGLPPQELNGDMVTIIEQWASLEDLKAHLSAPHMRSYQEKVKGMVEKVSLKVLRAA